MAEKMGLCFIDKIFFLLRFLLVFFGNKNSNREQLLATFLVLCTDRNILATAVRKMCLIFVLAVSYPQEMKKL